MIDTRDIVNGDNLYANRRHVRRNDSERWGVYDVLGRIHEERYDVDCDTRRVWYVGNSRPMTCRDDEWRERPHGNYHVQLGRS